MTTECTASVRHMVAIITLAMLPACAQSVEPAATIVVSSEASLSVSESGEQATLTVALSDEPDSTVTIQIASSDEGEVVVSTTSLTFDASNWSTPQALVLTGVNDAVLDGVQVVVLQIGPSRSADERFDGLRAAPMHVVNRDDDTAGILVGATMGTPTESGSIASFTVVLEAPPTAPVVLALESSDVSEGALATSSVTFNPSNWNEPQTVQVAGVNDDVADGPQPFAILFAVPTTTDAAYAQVSPPQSVMLVNEDDESAGGGP